VLGSDQETFVIKKHVARHFKEKHPKSPRFHNVTHFEFLIGDKWVR